MDTGKNYLSQIRDGIRDGKLQIKPVIHDGKITSFSICKNPLFSMFVNTTLERRVRNVCRGLLLNDMRNRDKQYMNVDEDLDMTIHSLSEAPSFADRMRILDTMNQNQKFRNDQLDAMTHAVYHQIKNKDRFNRSVSFELMKFPRGQKRWKLLNMALDYLYQEKSFQHTKYDNSIVYNVCHWWENFINDVIEIINTNYVKFAALSKGVALKQLTNMYGIMTLDSLSQVYLLDENGETPYQQVKRKYGINYTDDLKIGSCCTPGGVALKQLADMYGFSVTGGMDDLIKHSDELIYDQSSNINTDWLKNKTKRKK